jgi:tetratricopeptide (TPR) repeat protein
MATPASNEVTRLLIDWGDGNQAAMDELLPLVYDELRRLAGRYMRREGRDHTLQVSALINEAYLRLVDQTSVQWQNRAHFFGVAARAIDLNPSSAEAHSIYARYLSANDRMGESIAEANRAQELDPLSLLIRIHKGFVLTNARRNDEAIEQLRRVIAVDPDNSMAHWFLGIAYANEKRFDEAIASSERAVFLTNRAAGALGLLGMCYGLAGRKAEANKLADELLELNRHRYVTPVALVHVYIGLGARDEAFEWLEKAYQERSNFIAYLKVISIADPLRSDPRFDDLMRRIGFSQ